MLQRPLVPPGYEQSCREVKAVFLLLKTKVDEELGCEVSALVGSYLNDERDPWKWEVLVRMVL